MFSDVCLSLKLYLDIFSVITTSLIARHINRIYFAERSQTSHICKLLTQYHKISVDIKILGHFRVI